MQEVQDLAPPLPQLLQRRLVVLPGRIQLSDALLHPPRLGHQPVVRGRLLQLPLKTSLESRSS